MIFGNMRAVAGLILAGWLVALASFTNSAVAAPSNEQRQEVAAISTLISKAANLYKAEKFTEAGAAVKEAQGRLEKLGEGADGALLTLLAPPFKKLQNAHALLQLEGIDLPELKPLDAKPAPKPGEAGKPEAGDVSFVKQVAPILVARCGGCHVRRAQGDFSMATFEALMKGSKAGKVIFPKDVAGSVLIEKVADKEMPPNGGGIPDGELATLKSWVAQGALFDGPKESAGLAELTQGSAKLEAMPALTVKAATGKETISFSRDIAPILVASNCLNCHGAMRAQQNLSLVNFEGLLKGGDGGAPILPGKGADSFLVKKLRGTAAGARMPQNGDFVADELIAKVEKWIDEGATFDSPNPKQIITEVAALAKANASTHEELSNDRADLAMRNWRLAMPSVDAETASTTNFYVVGNVGPNVLKDIGESAETLAPKVAEIFKAPPGVPLVKGRMTLFVFKERYDYTEFGNMVERRELPKQWRGHFRFSGVDAYGVVVPSRSSEYSLKTLVAQQMASVYIAALGKGGTPDWFAQGAGRVAAAKLDTNDARVKAWDEALPQIMSSMASPDDFLAGKLDAESTDIAAYNFVKYLMNDSKKFGSLLDSLRKGSPFDKAFSDAYSGSPAQVTGLWVRKPPGKSRPVTTKGKK